MPPRYAYWTIIAGGLPTAFRAAERAELEPTFHRLKEKHPDAEMKWFARGKLWDSPEAARPVRFERNERGGRSDDGRDPRRASKAADERREKRGADWRPGGEHRDPRQKFKDAKRDRNQRWRKERFERRQSGGGQPGHSDAGRGGPREKPHGDKLFARPDKPRGDRKPFGDGRAAAGREGFGHGKASGNRKPFAGRRPDGQQKGRDAWRDDSQRRPKGRETPREKPHGDKLFAGADRQRGRKSFHDRKGFDGRKGAGNRKPFDDRKPFRDRNAAGAKPRDASRERGQESSRRREPPREKPHGDKLPARPDNWRRDRRSDKSPGQEAWSRPPKSKDRREGPGQRAPREKPHGDKLPARGFRPRAGFERNQGTDEPTAPPRPRGPNREPRPSDDPEPSKPPRPSEPAIRPPGPPERGRGET